MAEPTAERIMREDSRRKNKARSADRAAARRVPPPAEPVDAEPAKEAT